jgi:hypothetical protein
MRQIRTVSDNAKIENLKITSLFSKTNIPHRSHTHSQANWTLQMFISQTCNARMAAYTSYTSVYLTGVHLMGVYLTGVYLISMYTTSVHLMSVRLIGVYLKDVHLTGVHPIGVHLMGVHLMDVHQ